MGDWWDDHLQIYNAAVSAFLIFAVLKIQRCSWTLDLSTICALQVIFNAGDLLLDMPAVHYDGILLVFNGIELGIILILGGPRELHRLWYGKFRRHGPDSNNLSREVAQGVRSRKGHA